MTNWIYLHSLLNKLFKCFNINNKCKYTMNNRNKCIIFIEGNIGSGKTTLLHSLQSFFSDYICNVIIIAEPVEEWQPLLIKCNKNKKKFHALLQHKILDHYETVQNIINESNGIIIVERSVYSVEHIFIKCGITDGTISNNQFIFLERRIKNIKIVPDIHLYINTKPSVCFQRINDRGRNCELNLPYSYIKKLHNNHVIMCTNIDKFLYVNGDQSKRKLLKDVLNILENFKPFNFLSI